MTRSQSIMAALRREVERRAPLLDADGALHSVTVTVKLVVGTEQVRSVGWQEDRLAAPPRERREEPPVKELYVRDKTGV